MCTIELMYEPACPDETVVESQSGRGGIESRRQADATLSPTALDDGATTAGTHTSTEPVLLGSAVVVGLESTLHVVLLGTEAGVFGRVAGRL